jgi:hypothetical protein
LFVGISLPSKIWILYTGAKPTQITSVCSQNEELCHFTLVDDNLDDPHGILSSNDVFPCHSFKKSHGTEIVLILWKKRRRLRPRSLAPNSQTPWFYHSNVAIHLMMGSSLELDRPTLGKWQAIIENSVVLHQKYLQGANLTVIDAAPLVAAMDDYTL